MPGKVAYNPYDPAQAALLAGIMRAENASGNPSLGTGGVDLSNASVDQYGFPQWSGTGNSHAAGLYQFQPGTWDAVAAQYGLNFQNPQDQNAAAWYLAQDTFEAKTGGSLIDALQSGNYSDVQSALSGQWTGISGNAALPQGLASALPDLTNAADTQSAGQSGGSYLDGTPTQNFLNWFLGGNAESGSAGAGPQGGMGLGIIGGGGNWTQGLLGAITNWVKRFFLIALGGIIVIVALWYLLKDKVSA